MTDKIDFQNIVSTKFGKISQWSNPGFNFLRRNEFKGITVQIINQKRKRANSNRKYLTIRLSENVYTQLKWSHQERIILLQANDDNKNIFLAVRAERGYKLAKESETILKASIPVNLPFAETDKHSREVDYEILNNTNLIFNVKDK